MREKVSLSRSDTTEYLVTNDRVPHLNGILTVARVPKEGKKYPFLKKHIEAIYTPHPAQPGGQTSPEALFDGDFYTRWGAKRRAERVLNRKASNALKRR